MLIAANFHYVRHSFETPHPGIFGVTPAEFEAQLDVLGSAGDFVGARDIVAALDGETTLPPRCVCITFDDGLREQFDLAWPILRRRGIPAVFFANTRPVAEEVVLSVHKLHIVRNQVPTARLAEDLTDFCSAQGGEAANVDDEVVLNQYRYDPLPAARFKYVFNFMLPLSLQRQFVDQCFSSYISDDEVAVSRSLYMTREMLQELGAAGAVGSHGHDHLPLAQLDDAQARRQIAQAKALLDEWRVTFVDAFSYPYGGKTACSQQTGAMAAASGHRFAFTMERAGNGDLSAPMFLARFSNSDLPGGNAAGWGVGELFQAVPHASWFRAKETAA